MDKGSSKGLVTIGPIVHAIVAIKDRTTAGLEHGQDIKLKLGL